MVTRNGFFNLHHRLFYPMLNPDKKVEDFITKEKVLFLPSQLNYQGQTLANNETSNIFYLFNQLSPNDLEEVLQQYGVGIEGFWSIIFER